jgi:Eco29kI restriction endonuclease
MSWLLVLDRSWQPCDNRGLEPVTFKDYNPLDKENLGISVREALLRRPALPMAELLLRGPKHRDLRFPGAGIYAIYYVGDLPLYEPVAQGNKNDQFASPIYVGKAVPKGSRKGGIVKSEKPSSALCDRLRIHASGIDSATNLEIGDFYFRYLVVDDIWIPLGETYMIEGFRPIWNYIVAGFGIKTPGKRRKDQFTSLWDTVHPGRPFVLSLGLPPNPKTVIDIERDVNAFFTLPAELKAQLLVKDDGDLSDDDAADESEQQ